MLIWQAVHPTASGLGAHPLGWLLVALLGALAASIRPLERVHSYLPLAGGLAALALLALWREVIRIHYLAPLGYDIANYPIHVDWPTTFLFFSTLVGIGGLVGGFYLTLLYRAGRTSGLYSADTLVSRWGSSAVAVLCLWIAVFLAYGIVIWVRNQFVGH